ncbi:ABC transporter permease [Nonomuraea sp. CA-143628]|uniref:ABC transporter permease n=1 Tax=Nonomuraea sp. CA-143628 TaxID=3239997 RepID=UPI003D8A5434
MTSATGPAGAAPTEPDSTAGPVRPRRALPRVRSVAGSLLSRAATLVAASFLVFAAVSASPGDPVSQIVGTRASEVEREAVRQQLGLGRPFLERYWDWITDAISGDFGSSIIYRTDVSSLISARIGTTLMIVAYATVLIIVLGLTLGILGGAVRRLRAPMAAVTGLLLGVPQFVAAQVLVAFLAVQWNVFPVQGRGSGVLDTIHHLTLPALALAISWSAYVAQITMAAVKDEARRDHVDTARGRGIPPAHIFRRHVLRNAAAPVITVSGLTVAALFAGAIVVETAFNLPGLGTLLVKAVSDKDHNIVLAVSVIFVAVFIVVTTAIDFIQAALDPRIRQGRGRA